MQAKPMTIDPSDVDWLGWHAYDSGLQKARGELLRFLAERDHAKACDPRWLTITGPSGVGKTMMGKIVKNRYKKAKFVTWPRLMGRCVDERDWGYVKGLELYGTLIIDDVGAESAGLLKSSKGSLANLLYAREGKWTVITSNLSLAEIGDTYDVRISDRMLRNGSRVGSIPKEVRSFSLVNYVREVE